MILKMQIKQINSDCQWASFTPLKYFSLFVSDGPIGKPVINASHSSAFENQKVILTCISDHLDSSYSKCGKFRWNTSNEEQDAFNKPSKNNQVIFMMKESYEGKYQCQCENDYGPSDYSDPVWLTFLNSTVVGELSMNLLSPYVSLPCLCTMLLSN